MQMQKTEIAVAAGWEEDTSDVAIDNVAIENTPIQDTPQDALNPNTLVSNISLLDTEDRVAPNQINSEKPVWRNPIPRTILVMVGAGTLGFSLVRLTEGNGLINPTQNQVATNANSMSKPQVTGDEKGELQAKLANVGLKQQIDTLKMKKARKSFPLYC